MYYLCSENKGADQLCSYCTADMHLCFHLQMHTVGFLMQRLMFYLPFLLTCFSLRAFRNISDDVVWAITGPSCNFCNCI